jgi:hypothetical protein
MKSRSALPALALLAALALASCGRKDVPTTATVNGDHSDTSVLGSSGPGSNRAPAPLTDARGQAIPPPPVPTRTQAQAVRSGDESALAVWVQDGHVVASTWTRAAGWTAAQPLEEIYGAASDPQLASNGNGIGMAVWRHTVGSIQALRYSRFEQGTGWTTPDVLPGALPRPDVGGPSGGGDAPRLRMDAQGNVVAQWQSGFDTRELQVARYVAGQGWTRAASEPVASAQNASPAPPAPSSVR